jgi:hypothetical protein
MKSGGSPVMPRRAGRLHRGAGRVQSALTGGRACAGVGEGTTFTIYLPGAKPAKKNLL